MRRHNQTPPILKRPIEVRRIKNRQLGSWLSIIDLGQLCPCQAILSLGGEELHTPSPPYTSVDPIPSPPLALVDHCTPPWLRINRALAERCLHIIQLSSRCLRIYPFGTDRESVTQLTDALTQRTHAIYCLQER